MEVINVSISLSSIDLVHLQLQMSLEFMLDVPRHAEMSTDIRIIAFGTIVLQPTYIKIYQINSNQGH